MSNVKLTGRGTESRKTKPYYTRASVERNVRLDMWLQDLPSCFRTRVTRWAKVGFHSPTFIQATINATGNKSAVSQPPQVVAQ